MASMAHDQTIYHQKMVEYNQQQLNNQTSMLSCIKSFVTNSSESFKTLKDNSNQTLSLMLEANVRSASLTNQVLKLLHEMNNKNDNNHKFQSFSLKSTTAFNSNYLDELSVANAIQSTSSPSSS